jgi:predicted acylesterase/phospholipase RssA
LRQCADGEGGRLLLNDEFLKEVAAEHMKGRRLLIGTTNLDAQRPVIWDMGKIALSGHPEALDLFRKILVASAAIPAVFPPGFVEVARTAAPLRRCMSTAARRERCYHGQVS